jgi:hypothetical protein
MSKVAIKGNASGTGTFTIAAPNSNENRTLTLPDEAGTVLTSASDVASSQLPSGSQILISEDADGASGIDELDITLPSSGYDHFILVVNGYYHSTGAETWFRFWESGVVKSGASDYGAQVIGRRNGIGTNGRSSNAESYMRTNWYGPGDSSGEPSDILVYIFNTNKTAVKSSISGFVNGIAADSNVSSNWFNGIRNALTTAEKIQLGCTAGTFAYSNHQLYGVKS